MEDVISTAELQLVERTANFMQFVLSMHDFSEADQEPNVHEKGSVGRQGENFARAVEMELKQCPTSLTHLQSFIEQVRTTYLRLFTNTEFRKAAKVHVHVWIILEGRRGDLEEQLQAALEYSIERLLSDLMSPVGVEGGTPSFEDAPIDDDKLLDFYRRLPGFVGISDHLDTETDVSISNLLSRPLISPNWYQRQDVSSYDDFVDEFMASDLYERISDRNLALSRTHWISMKEGFVQTIGIMEYQSNSAFTPFRCLVADITYRGAEGHDFYISLKSPIFSEAKMLVGSPDDPVVELITYKVFLAYAQALQNETGDSVDIETFVSEIEKEQDEEED
ncbi:hypothetical protein [Alicyclobacillus sp. SO9]|uniref:hypothetical protein n=1 Tax=Alicyclobacillus sp. SO9 TaxID=2665646 RepID=UPI001E3F2D19|nr:hypothetical protein [Alicyclobacillus sp. SO9]